MFATLMAFAARDRPRSPTCTGAESRSRVAAASCSCWRRSRVVPAPDDRRLPDRVPHARRRHRRRRRGGRSRRTCRAGSRSCSSATQLSSTRSSPARRDDRRRGCCSGWPTRRGGSGAGALFWPVLVFTGFVVFGLVRGQVLGGGDTRIAIFEARPLLYLPLVYILVTNLLTTRRQYQRLLLLAFVGDRRSRASSRSRTTAGSPT